jgi:hypothetical protein
MFSRSLGILESGKTYVMSWMNKLATDLAVSMTMDVKERTVTRVGNQEQLYFSGVLFPCVPVRLKLVALHALNCNSYASGTVSAGAPLVFYSSRARSAHSFPGIHRM